MLAQILNVVIFLDSICLNIKVLEEKKIDLVIIQEDTFFPRILSIRWTELILYSVCGELSLAYTQYARNWVELVLSMRDTVFSLLYSV